MVHPDKLFGRLGNRLFQMATLFAYSKDNDVDIYFQDPKWFEKYEDEIKVLFAPRGKPINQVAIHVRRGDYINNPFYVNLTETTYYDDAIKLFPNDTFIVFSDDIEWCKNYFIGDHFDFSEGNSEVEDLDLMSSCKAVITANSSFSWWGGFLCRGNVVAPLAWHPDKVERTVCPSNWIRL